jgi:hypothetical protein
MLAAALGASCGGDADSSFPPGGPNGTEAATSGATTSGSGGGPTSSGAATSSSASTGGGGPSEPPACGSGIAVAGELCFAQPYAQHPSGVRDHRAIVVADCDGDQDPDLIVPSRSDDVVAALRNDGKGAFPDVEKSKTLANPIAIAAGELDGNEGVDIATAHAGSGPEGRSLVPLFASAQIPCSFIMQPYLALDGQASDVGIGAINDDALDDIVGTSSQSGAAEVAFWINLPATEPSLLDEGAQRPEALVLADVDGDKRADLIYTGPAEGKVYYRSNTGVGYAIQQGFPPAGSLGQTHDLAAGDLDGDGDQDVVVTDAAGDAVVVLRNDKGVLAPEKPISVLGANGLGAVPMRIALGDMDGDGHLDIVVASWSAQPAINVLLNDGQAGFTPAVGGNAQGVLVASDFPKLLPERPHALALADLNGDGALDIVTASDASSAGTSRLTVWLANP